LQIVYSQGAITPEEVIHFIHLSGQAHAIYAEIIRRKEVMKKAKELGLSASDEALQKVADDFRRLHGLYSAQETMRFLTKAGLTELQLETFCESGLLAEGLKGRLADEKRVREYFLDNRSQFDIARISIMVVLEKNLADELATQVKEDGLDFHTLARKYSADESSKFAGGYVGWIARRELDPAVVAKVFNASAGDVLGPFEKDGSFQLLLVEEVKRAEFTEDVKEAIKERFFQEWVRQFLKDDIHVHV
jgi:parvulin-like peptidyl-prolyl isomerase